MIRFLEIFFQVLFGSRLANGASKTKRKKDQFTLASHADSLRDSSHVPPLRATLVGEERVTNLQESLRERLSLPLQLRKTGKYIQ